LSVAFLTANLGGKAVRIRREVVERMISETEIQVKAEKK
jgi:hypothetical protein